MKEQFKIKVKARDSKHAFECAAPRGKTSFKYVTDSLSSVVEAIEGKRKRVLQNPSLYADKIAEYEKILSQVTENQKIMPEPEVVAAALLDHGDSRVDNRTHCCVIDLGGGSWLVFGLYFP